MHKDIELLLEKLTPENLDNYVKLVSNNVGLSALNHAHLFLTSTAQNTVLTKSKIESNGLKKTGVESEIYIPMLKDGLTLGKVKVYETRKRKRNLDSVNLILKISSVYGKIPIRYDGLIGGSLGYFDKNSGEIYISSLAYKSLASINIACIEILSGVLLEKEGLNEKPFVDFFKRLAFLYMGMDIQSDFDRQALVNILNERLLVQTSDMIRLLSGIIEGIDFNDGEIMILRLFMKEDVDQTVDILGKAYDSTEDYFIRAAIRETSYRLKAISESCFQSLYIQKKEKRLPGDIKRRGFIDTKLYLEEKYSVN